MSLGDRVLLAPDQNMSSCRLTFKMWARAKHLSARALAASSSPVGKPASKEIIMPACEAKLIAFSIAERRGSAVIEMPVACKNRPPDRVVAVTSLGLSCEAAFGSGQL